MSLTKAFFTIIRGLGIKANKNPSLQNRGKKASKNVSFMLLEHNFLKKLFHLLKKRHVRKACSMVHVKFVAILEKTLAQYYLLFWAFDYFLF